MYSFDFAPQDLVMALQLRYPEEADFRSRVATVDSTTDDESSKREVSACFRLSPYGRQQLQNKSVLPVHRLVVATGDDAARFAQRVVDATPDAQILGSLVLSNMMITESTFGSTPSRVCSIVSLSQDVVVVVAPYKVDEMHAWEWTDALLARFAPTHIVSLSTLVSLTYDDDLHEACSLRKLLTSPNALASMNDEIATLASPRFVTGIPAALLTFCHLHGLQGSLFVVLYHSTTSWRAIVSAYLPILNLVQAETTTKLSLIGDKDRSASSFMGQTASFAELYI
ncbi:hypothetical protein AC1031_011491 [Aphanomyces cochlioides]|nr:hypothetical protein AC1031_011491 [Aphanomyces cochlioides]